MQFIKNSRKNNKLFITREPVKDTKFKSKYNDFSKFKSEEEIEYELALEKRRNTFLLFRIFIKKPILKQRDMINCRCSMPDISIKE